MRSGNVRRRRARGLAKAPGRPTSAREFERAIDGKLPDNWADAVAALKQEIADSKPKIATRQSGQKVLETLIPATPELVGGSADLTGSNLTLVKGQGIIAPGDFSGRYIHYGVREHGMAAAANGMALHGGIIPYTGTFFVFTDYMRPAIRLGALMRQRVIHVLTHDSIGLGEDGPTHQPIEHLASLRAMPNVHVYRPADTMETAECWELAVRRHDGPSLLVLTRQALPALRFDTAQNCCARGGYVLAEAEGPRQATLIATGSEVSLAMEARAKLAAEGIQTAVVSLPCWDLFEAQDAEYRAAVLGHRVPGRYRGSLRIRLGPVVGPGWRLHRHDRIWCVSAG